MKFLHILLALALALQAAAQEFESGSIAYVVTAPGQVAVTQRLLPGGVNDYSDVLIVPPTVFFDGETYSVTAVDQYAFAASGVTEVVLPNSISSLGESAFADADRLSSVTLPLALRHIPRYCFAGTALVDVALPPEVSTIGYGAFEECTALHTVFLPPALTAIGNHAFDWCINLYEIYCTAPLPPSVGDDAFAFAPQLDIVVADDAHADLYALHPQWGNDSLFTIFPDEDLAPTTLLYNSEPFRRDWLAVELGNHLAYKIYDSDDNLIAYTAARHAFLPAPARHDAVYTIVPATTADALPDYLATVTVPATSGIERLIPDDEPISPIPEPLITARDGQIHIWGDNYHRAIRVYDIYGTLYYERFTSGNEAIELPSPRLYIVTVDNYVRKVLL